MKKYLLLSLFAISAWATETIVDSTVLRPATLPTTAKSGALRIDGSGVLQKYYSGSWAPVGVTSSSFLDNAFTLQDSAFPTKQAMFQLSDITSGATRVFTFPDYDGVLITSSGSSGISNKSFYDSSNYFVDNGDTTKKLAFELSGITTGQTRTLTPPNYNGTIATLAGNETFTNKTYSYPELYNSINTSFNEDSTTTGTNATITTTIGFIIRLTNASLVSVCGMNVGSNHQILELFNDTGSNITIANNATCTANTRFTTGTGSDLVFNSGSSLFVTRDFNASRWRILNSASASSVSPLTSKGDLYTYSTLNDRLAVGTNGQVLKANSAMTTGLNWGGIASDSATDSTAGSDLTINPTASFMTLTGAVVNIAGFNAPTYSDYKSFTIINKTGSNFSVTNERSVATAANRILVGQADAMTLKNGESQRFFYDVASLRWRTEHGVLFKNENENRSPDELSNYAITSSVGASALTINLKDGYGNAPSTDTNLRPRVGFRSGTITSGFFNTLVLSSASVSLTIPSGATLGQSNGVSAPIYVYLNESGEIGVSGTRFDDNSIMTSTVIDAAADSSSILYSQYLRTGYANRLIGKIVNTQATAGTWATSPSEIDLAPLPVVAGGGGGVTTMAAIGSTPNANGATISGATLNLQPASDLYGGVLTTGAQEMSGDKMVYGMLSNYPTIPASITGITFGLYSTVQTTLSSNNSFDMFGSLATVGTDGGYTQSGDIYGASFAADNGSIGTTGNVYGVMGTANKTAGFGGGNTPKLYGVYGSVGIFGSGTVTDAYSLYSAAPQAPAAGTITNAYGLYISSVSAIGTTLNYSMYVAGGKSKFDGNADETQLTIEGHSTQTSKIFDVQKSDATKLLSVTNVNGTKIKGTTTNDSAAAGYVGEVISSSVAEASGVSLTSGSGVVVTSISLTAGDWDVSGIVGYTGAATIGMTFSDVGTSSGGTGVDGTDTAYFATAYNVATYGPIQTPIRTRRVYVSGTTTYNLNSMSYFTAGTGFKAFGTIEARRAR